MVRLISTAQKLAGLFVKNFAMIGAASSVCEASSDPNTIAAFQERLAAHWANLNNMKWMLWNDGVEMAEHLLLDSNAAIRA
jgi:hypothetical protein